MSFFRRMFGAQPRSPRPPIEHMTINQAFEYLRAGSGTHAVSDLIAVFRRVSDLALFEPGISDSERNAALEVATALHTDIQTGLANDPPALTAFEEAADFHLHGARTHGYGSLHWKMQEQEVGPSEVIAFIALPEHAELLPDYLEMLEPEDIAEIRQALLSSMANLRANEGELPLLALGRLAATNDGAMTMLLSGPELSALVQMPNDQEHAASVLREIGINLG